MSKTEIFIEKANKIHNNEYDYSKTIYTKVHEKVIITCKVHGDFTQTPNVHLNGRGCPECGKKKSQSHNRNLQKKSSENFITKANLLHENFYDYSKFVYVNSNTKGIIICPLHGEFLKEPNKHINRGQACPECAKTKVSSKGEITIRKYLTENEFDFVQGYYYKRSKYLRNKPYDFFIEGYNLLIEYQGEQHFKKKFNMTDEDLKLRKEIDRKKRAYAKKYGFNYLDITYKEDIVEKLDKYFSSTTIETTSKGGKE